VLILGTDSREGLTGQSAKDAGKGKVSGNRPDSLMILRIDPKTHQGWTLSIPRDLWVRVDGTGKWDRINGSFSGKQPAARLIRTIRGNLGIPINHVMAANFAGFQKLIGTVGGVNLCFPLPSRDTWTGLNQGAGCHQLDERQALAYARSRHFEEFRKGKWTPDGKGDLGRIVRQQAFLRASLRRAIDAGAGNPLTLNAMLAQSTINSGSQRSPAWHGTLAPMIPTH
jgi:LCP family protein required for cell wall assembly